MGFYFFRRAQIIELISRRDRTLHAQLPLRISGKRRSLRDLLKMLAAEDPRGIFRPCKAPDAGDAGGIGKSGNVAGAEKSRAAVPPVFSNGS